MEFTELRYQDAATGTYLGSPSLVQAPSGDLLATHDYFGPACPLNQDGEEHLSSVYRSSDGGRTWSNVTHLAGAFWSSLFVHEGSVYLLGTSAQYGAIVVRRSEDNGNTWTHPASGSKGFLFRAGPGRLPPNYHCAPTPVIVHKGRIYRAFEDCDPCVWGTGFWSHVISAPAGADLLDDRSWTMSKRIGFDRSWAPRKWRGLTCPGVLEGNVVVTPRGSVWNILRFHSAPYADKAVILRVLNDGREQRFHRCIDFPGGLSKFTIRRDPVTSLYLALVNDVKETRETRRFLRSWNMCPRNRLSLIKSRDLVHWEHVTTLVEDDSPLPRAESLRRTGFQYADWQFDGDDIIYVVRTAYGGAHNLHDANRITFHRLEGFRKVISAR